MKLEPPSPLPLRSRPSSRRGRASWSGSRRALLTLFFFSGIGSICCQGLSSGCVSKPGSLEAAEPAPVALDLVADSPWPEPYASDVLWRRAETGTDLDDARLAQRESAAFLVAALAEGGSLGRTALRALHYASDRRDMRGELCALLVGPAPATLSLLLEALLEVMTNGPITEETLDPGSDSTCTTALSSLGRDVGLSPTDQDRVSSALARLERAPTRK
jgi:hypothetical protein